MDGGQTLGDAPHEFFFFTAAVLLFCLFFKIMTNISTTTIIYIYIYIFFCISGEKSQRTHAWAPLHTPLGGGGGEERNGGLTRSTP